MNNLFFALILDESNPVHEFKAGTTKTASLNSHFLLISIKKFSQLKRIILDRMKHGVKIQEKTKGPLNIVLVAQLQNVDNGLLCT